MSTKLIKFIFVYLLSSIFAMEVDQNVYFEREKNYFGLPNELPTLSGMAVLRDDDLKSYVENGTSLREKIYKIKNLVGALPVPEQVALFESMEANSTKYFNTTKFINTLQKRNLYKKEYENIMNYIEDYEKQFPYGMGCLQYTSNRLAFDTKYNEDMHKILYNFTEEIIETHFKLVQSKITLINAVLPILLNNRKKLYSIDSTLTCKSNQIICDENDEFTGISFSEGDKSEIISNFKTYFNDQIAYTSKLSNLVILSEIAISNMDGCRNYKDPNNEAAESSTYVTNPKITYKKSDKQQKGINENSRIGIDNRTSNGFKLFKGYFSGGSKRHDNTSNIYYYLPRIIVDDLDTILKALNSFPTNDTKIKFINDFKSNLNLDTVNTEIDSEILKVFADISNTETPNLKYLKDKELIENVTRLIIHQCPLNYYIYCTNGECNYIENDFSSETKIKLHSTVSKDSELLYGCLYNQHPIGILKNNNKYSGFGNGEKMEFILKMTNQACFGVFTSGGKNDKDACRDVLKDKCGIELDYHCKKLGLYDYLNSNPSVVSIPDEIKNDDTKFFTWIYTNFTTSGLSLKPSAIVGTNLLLQKSINDITPIEKSSETPSLNIPINYNDFTLDQYSLLKQSKESFKYYVNKGNHFIMENSDKYLYNSIFFFLVFLILFL